MQDDVVCYLKSIYHLDNNEKRTFLWDSEGVKYNYL